MEESSKEDLTPCSSWVDYPENPELHLVRLRKAMTAGRRLMEILEAIVKCKQSALHDG